MEICIDNITVNVKDKIPLEWKQKDNARAFIYGYRVFGVKKNDMGNKPLRKFLIGNMIVLLFHGTFIYSDPTKKIYEIENSELKFSNPKSVKSTEDTYLFLITSAEEKGLECTMLGLLNAFLGKNITCEYMFNNYIFISEESKGTVTEYPVDNYARFATPDISDAKFGLIKRAFNNILSKNDVKKRKIIFSLSWFFEANNRENENRNIFIKSWIAIETLTMNSTRREPIGEILGNIYSMDSADALDYFKIQKIYKIRCKIVHDGELVNLDSAILSYLQDLYVDLLFYMINVQSQFKAKGHIESGLSVESYLNNSVSHS